MADPDVAAAHTRVYEPHLGLDSQTALAAQAPRGRPRHGHRAVDPDAAHVHSARRRHVLTVVLLLVDLGLLVGLFFGLRGGG